jgi:hypothetical protein
MGTGEEPGLNSGHVGHLIPHYIMESLHFKHTGVCERPGFALGSEKLDSLLRQACEGLPIGGYIWLYA